MNKDVAIEKVRLLLRLASNTTANEASAAKAMADKLIEKYSLTEEEYNAKEAEPIYTDSNLLFEEAIPTDWRAQLAIICGNKFDCYIIQEKNVSVITGDTTFKFFIYGNKDDITLTRTLFKFISAEIEDLVASNCQGRGQLYTESYCEGVVAGARSNIESEKFNVKGIVNAEKEQEAPDTKTIEKVKEPKKEKPIEATTDLSTKEKPLDITAYWQGEYDGGNIHIEDGSGKKELTSKKDAKTKPSMWDKLLDFIAPNEDFDELDE